MKPRKTPYRQLVFSIGFTVVMLVMTSMLLAPIPFSVLVKKLFFPLVRLMGFISIGLAVGQVIESKGWTRQMAVVARPLFSFSNLGDRCGAAFTSAFISGATANAMLLEYYEENQISKTQLFLTNWVNQFPAFFLHLPTTVFIVLPLTGLAGLLYFVITFAATLLRTLCFLVAGFVFLPAPGKASSFHVEQSSKGSKNPRPTTMLQTLKSRLPKRVMRITVWVLPIYTLVFVLNMNGFFEYLNQTVASSFTAAFIPVESMSVVVLSFAAEFTSGFAAAGALMQAGVLTTKQTVMALLIGNVLAFPIRALRHQLPRYMGIFSPKMGLQVLLSGQMFRVASIIFVGALYYMVA